MSEKKLYDKVLDDIPISFQSHSRGSHHGGGVVTAPKRKTCDVEDDELLELPDEPPEGWPV